MSTRAHAMLHRVHRPQRWVGWAVVGALAAAGIGLGVDRLLPSGATHDSWPPEPCVVEGRDAHCGTLRVPENRAHPNGRTIGLHVVVVPALVEETPHVAVTYLTGGPGDAATEQWFAQGWQSSRLNTFRDVLLVDQRGTGGSNPGGGDVTQYGTRMAMDDLDAVRAALGYRRLDVFGSSYGATAAQVYLTLHPTRVRTLVLFAGTAIDVPILDRWAVNAQRALDQLAALCASDAACRKRFPGWERRFGQLVRAWNAHPGPMTGDELAAVVHVMLLDVDTAVSIPFVVSTAAKGDYGPLERAGSGDLHVGDLNVMGSSIWCNEPWVGLDARGPWGTDFDGYATAFGAGLRHECSSVPKRTEPRALWTLPRSSRVPVLAFVGGADPQDPIGNLGDWKRHFPDSRTVILPHTGHRFHIGSCVDELMADFVAAGTTSALDTRRCDGSIVVPPFELGN